MYAVVTTGGKQYRVEAGSELLIEKLAADQGASVTFDRVLLVGDGDDVTVGTPLVAGASVTGTVLREERGPKIVIFKFKQKVKYRRRTGHRQHLTMVRIDEINAEGGSKKRARAKAEPEAEASAPAEASAAAEEKPKARTTRSRAAKPKAEADATASTEEAPEKPKRRSPARTAKAQKAKE